MDANGSLDLLKKFFTRIRKKRRWSGSALARASSVDQSQVHRFEKSERTITIGNLIKLARGCQMTAEEALEFTEIMTGVQLSSRATIPASTRKSVVLAAIDLSRDDKKKLFEFLKLLLELDDS